MQDNWDGHWFFHCMVFYSPTTPYESYRYLEGRWLHQLRFVLQLLEYSALSIISYASSLLCLMNIHSLVEFFFELSPKCDMMSHFISELLKLRMRHFSNKVCFMNSFFILKLFFNWFQNKKKQFFNLFYEENKKRILKWDWIKNLKF